MRACRAAPLRELHMGCGDRGGSQEHPIRGCAHLWQLADSLPQLRSLVIRDLDALGASLLYQLRQLTGLTELALEAQGGCFADLGDCQVFEVIGPTLT